MRIVIIGQSAFGAGVLNALVDGGENVVGVFCPRNAGDPVKDVAQRHNTPVFQFQRLRSQEAIDALAGLNADLGVMAYVTDIVPAEMLAAPSRGTIQYHPSLLPKHRGPSAINWAIIQGETRTGLTIFWPDAGIDTGPILLQKEVAIGPNDTVGSLYFEKLFPLGIEAMVEAVEMVRNGTAPRIPQDESQATYEGWCRAADVGIDWSRPVGEVYNLIRGSDPGPGANTIFNGKRVHVYRASKQGGEFGRMPGEVIEVDESGFVVAARGGAIRIGRVQPAGRGKVPAAEWGASIGLAAGARFGKSDLIDVAIERMHEIV